MRSIYIICVTYCVLSFLGIQEIRKSRKAIPKSIEKNKKFVKVILSRIMILILRWDHKDCLIYYWVGIIRQFGTIWSEMDWLINCYWFSLILTFICITCLPCRNAITGTSIIFISNFYIMQNRIRNFVYVSAIFYLRGCEVGLVRSGQIGFIAIEKQTKRSS